MNKFFAGLGIAAAIALTSGSASAAGDAAKGAAVFKKVCAVCHDVGTVNKVGPGLKGIVGRKSASIAGFAYSPAMKEAGLTWDVATLDKYLENPAGLVPKNKMAIPGGGVKAAADRADVIAYVETLK